MSTWYDPLGIFGSGGSSSDMDDVMYMLKQYEDMLTEAYNPYIEYGMRAMPTLEEQYAALVNNPAAIQTMLGQDYKQSPGYQYQYEAGMNAANQANAAGGMLGTPAHQAEAAGTATGLANQDYWNYYNQNKNLYQMGLTGTQGQFDTGFNATNQMMGGMGNLYGSMANLTYTDMMNQQMAQSSMMGALGGVAGWALGGPMGGMAGSAIGGAL